MIGGPKDSARRRAAIIVADCLWLSAATTCLAEPVNQTQTGDHLLQSGLYEIEVSTQTVEGRTVVKPRLIRRCFRATAIREHRMFEILSDTPAAACPKYEICTNGPRTGLQTLCEGPVDASAVGMFALEGDRFRGRIDIDREQPARALVEIQYGTRVGDCPDL